MTKIKRCKTCDFCGYFWRGIRADKKQFYCKAKLHEENLKGNGDRSKAYIKPNDVACERHTGKKTKEN